MRKFVLDDEDNTVYVFIPNSHFIQNLETATCKEQYLYWKMYLAVNVLKTCFCSF